jgi:hypothetical protein
MPRGVKRNGSARIVVTLDADLRQKVRDAANELKTSESNVIRAFVEYVLAVRGGTDPHQAAVDAARRTVLWDVLAAVRLSPTAILPALTAVVDEKINELIGGKFNPPPIPSVADEHQDLFAALEGADAVPETIAGDPDDEDDDVDEDDDASVLEERVEG